MAWRIVKQPNGLLARFSDIVDNFTHMDMTEAEAFEVCREYLGIEDAKRKVLAGVEDHIPYTNSEPGNGHERWDDAIARIDAVHGKEAVEQCLHPTDGTLPPNEPIQAENNPTKSGDANPTIGG